MGATRAAGGVNPISGQRVIEQQVCHDVLAVMLTAGLYDTSGEWLYDVAGKVTLLAKGAGPPFVASLLAAGAMVVLRVVTVERAYRSVPWTTIVLRRHVRRLGCNH